MLHGLFEMSRCGQNCPHWTEYYGKLHKILHSSANYHIWSWISITEISVVRCLFLACNFRTNPHAIAMMFICLSVCLGPACIVIIVTLSDLEWLFHIIHRPSPASSLKVTDRSFQYASPNLWNKLPSSLREPVSPLYMLTSIPFTSFPIHHPFTLSL